MSQDRLQFIAQSIAKAKKVMDKVESGNYSTGHIDQEFVAGKKQLPHNAGTYAPAPVAEQYAPMDTNVPQPLKNLGTSKIPNKILESFQKNPGMGVVNTSNPLAINSFGMEALAETTKTIQQPSYRSKIVSNNKPTFSEQTQYIAAPLTSTTTQAAQPQYISAPVTGPVLSEDYVKFLINQAVEATVAATVKAVMEELNKPTTIDENIQIKIGNKTFGGKIKTLKS